MKCLFTMFAAVVALTAVAQGPSGRGMGRTGLDPIMRAAQNPKMAEKIGLSEEQQSKLKALASEKDVVKSLQAKVSAGTKRQSELLKAEKIDEAAVLATVDEIFEARKEIAKCQMKRLIAVKTVLTPEQIKAATEALQSMKDQRKGAKKGKRAPKTSAPEA